MNDKILLFFKNYTKLFVQIPKFYKVIAVPKSSQKRGKKYDKNLVKVKNNRKYPSFTDARTENLTCNPDLN